MPGIEVSGLFRDLLVLYGHPYKEAVEISKSLDQKLKGMDWLSLYDGTTFEKTYTPEGYKFTRIQREGIGMAEEKEGLKMRNIIIIGGLAVGALLLFGVVKARATVQKVSPAMSSPPAVPKKKTTIQLPAITIPWPFSPKTEEAKPYPALTAGFGLRLRSRRGGLRLRRIT
ncbi:MAG: hypothetical protein K6T73_01255 [Candidatus Bathyarchaeota archaeon]|nr:hypothetical protein [Candidatus Bathyarchaeota archaeon]